MPINQDDMQDIYRGCDDRYVKKTDCNDRNAATNARFALDDKRIAIFEHDFAMIKKLVGVVASTSIAQLIMMIFEKLMG